ncbi:protein phosphatase 2C domain-containing protein [Mycobacterium frederiksbergense]|uniref:PP2C family serine/threonine-protein phosphatase n=1 Tax=Mycolicibacterium frederiksbergense TaxID=117567 RepID=UPI0021F340B0|nr:PP2C family serine/threonine-protein phosphatase [Mycolicibacterium frederiksbergense]MCV7044730.1 protein phosphatase 2C domain-containing protein [Mycolicibacterium frederiksbergense]
MTAAAENRPGSWEWAVCGASVTGQQHLKHGLGCDDAYSYGVAGDLVIAAVADGAGSVSGTSAWGSYVACQSVLRNAMRSRFRRDFATDPSTHPAQMRWLFEQALAQIRVRANAMNLELPLLSTTLSVAVADSRHAMFGQIGDGVIAVETERGVGTLLIESKDEYANTTWFLQSDRAFDTSFRTCSVKDVTAFALSTDGMSYKITDIATGEPYTPFFRGSWQHVREGASSSHFASLLRGIVDDQTGDDKTMVLSALRWETDEFYPSARPKQTLSVGSPAPRVRSTPAQRGGRHHG